MPDKENALRVVQISHPEQGRAVAVVEGESLRLVVGHTTLYGLANMALASNVSLCELITDVLSEMTLDYDAIYEGRSDWKLLVPFDHPNEPARCLVAGTGLTHRKGAANRDAMHQAKTDAPPTVTDSMKIYQWGEAEGRPEAGKIGVQPEWFYKGNGTILQAHGEPLPVPNFADDGGEEPEVAGVYLIDPQGTPRRLGFVTANEFSDHQMERKNYLYLAPSKLRACAIGPEIALGADFIDLPGEVRIERKGETLWSSLVATGETHMVHSLANLEHHHFKYPAHQYPGDVHIHFFGTGAFSFGAGVTLEAGDVMQVSFPALGRPLRNPLTVDSTPLKCTEALPL